MGGANWRSESRAHVAKPAGRRSRLDIQRPRQGKERRVEARECAMLAATVDTVPHTQCFAVGAVLRELNAVASVSIRKQSGIFPSGEIEIGVH